MQSLEKNSIGEVGGKRGRWMKKENKCMVWLLGDNLGDLVGKSLCQVQIKEERKGNFRCIFRVRNQVHFSVFLEICISKDWNAGLISSWLLNCLLWLWFWETEPPKDLRIYSSYFILLYTNQISSQSALGLFFPLLFPIFPPFQLGPRVKNWGLIVCSVLEGPL